MTINIVIWYCIIKIIEFAAIKGNPVLLVFPILLSYIIIVVEGVFKSKTSGE